MEKRHVIIAGAVFVVLAIAIAIYLFSVYIPSTTIGSSPEEGLLKCNSLGSPVEGAINLLFFANGEAQVIEYSNFLFETPPYTNYKDRFNVYYIDNYAPECDTYKGVATFCHSRTLLKRAASCPNDYVIVLVENLVTSIRSSSYQNVVSINTLHPLTVLTHEFAHAFADLADEYVPAGKLPSSQRNCAAQCENFQGMENGCFDGCTNNEHIRSISNGVMRTLSNNIYGSFNEFLVTEAILDQSSDVTTPITGRQTIVGDQTCVLVEYNEETEEYERTIIDGFCPDKEVVNTFVVYTDTPGKPTEEQPQPPADGETIEDETLPKIFVVSVEKGEKEVEFFVEGPGGEITTETITVPEASPELAPTAKSGVISKIISSIFTKEKEQTPDQKETSTPLRRIIERQPADLLAPTKLFGGISIPTTAGNTTGGNETNATTESFEVAPSLIDDPLGDYPTFTTFATSDLGKSTLPKTLFALLLVAILVVLAIIKLKKKSRG